MGVRFCKYQIFLLSMVACLGVSDVGYGFSLKHKFHRAVTTVHEVTHPFRKNVACYGECTQKMGRQGGQAFQDYFRQHADLASPEVVRLLKNSSADNSLETQRQARKAMACLKGCRLSMTVRFLAQFLGSMEDERAVRAAAIILGLTSDGWGKKQSQFHMKTEQGHDTKLFTIVFHKQLHRSCSRVLRYEKTKIFQFQKNLDTLRQVFFEMYGPIPKAAEYAKDYGL